jgi:hypothetical protein
LQIIDSPVQEDECGVCGGDGSKCRQKSRSFVDKVTSKVGGMKLVMIPAGARNIRIAFRSAEVSKRSELFSKGKQQYSEHEKGRKIYVFV